MSYKTEQLSVVSDFAPYIDHYDVIFDDVPGTTFENVQFIFPVVDGIDLVLVSKLSGKVYKGELDREPWNGEEGIPCLRFKTDMTLTVYPRECGSIMRSINIGNKSLTTIVSSDGNTTLRIHGYREQHTTNITNILRVHMNINLELHTEINDEVLFFLKQFEIISIKYCQRGEYQLLNNFDKVKSLTYTIVDFDENTIEMIRSDMKVHPLLERITIDTITEDETSKFISEIVQECLNRSISCQLIYMIQNGLSIGYKTSFCFSEENGTNVVTIGYQSYTGKLYDTLGIIDELGVPVDDIRLAISLSPLTSVFEYNHTVQRKRVFHYDIETVANNFEQITSIEVRSRKSVDSLLMRIVKSKAKSARFIQ